MAHSTLPSLTHSEFPQVFTQAIDDLVDRLAARPQLGQCWYEDEYCDCRAQAVVHNLATEQEFCLRHFLAVNRG